VKKGTIKFYFDAKGFGFIKHDDGSPDIFVQISGLVDRQGGELREGDKVEYDIGESRGRPCAEFVQIVR
jgi:CspA family cold shock protein